MVTFCERAHTGPVEDIAINTETIQRRVASAGGGSVQIWELRNDSKFCLSLTVPPLKLHRHLGQISCTSTEEALRGEMRAVLRSWRYRSTLFLRKPRNVSLSMTKGSLVAKSLHSVAYNVQPFSEKWSTLIPTRMFVPSFVFSNFVQTFPAVDMQNSQVIKGLC